MINEKKYEINRKNGIFSKKTLFFLFVFIFFHYLCKNQRKNRIMGKFPGF